MSNLERLERILNGGKGSGNRNPGRGWGPGKPGYTLSLDSLEKIFIDTYDPNHFSVKGRESYQLEAIAKEIGYDKKPVKVSNEEFNSNLNQVLYRGVRDNIDKFTDEILKTESEIIDEFYNGPYYAGEGKYGPGIYMSQEREYSLSPEYSQSGRLIEAKLSDDAKIINIRQELETSKERKFREGFIEFKTSKSNEYLKKSEAEYRKRNNDLGERYEQIAECYSYLEETTYAALKGYDAVQDNNGEYVVLNRGKLIYTDKTTNFIDLDELLFLRNGIINLELNKK